MVTVEDFLQDCLERGMTPGTIRSYRWNVEDFLKYLGEKQPQDADRKDLKGYLDSLRARGVSKKAAGLYFAAIKTFYDYLVYEELMESNPIDPIRKRYLQSYKASSQGHTHQIVTIDEAAQLINALVDIRDKALVVLLFKTGIRRRELISLDVEDINWKDQSITLKLTAKRSNRLVFFDDEAAHLLRRWIKARDTRAKPGEHALFIGIRGRLGPGGVDKIIKEGAFKTGLWDKNSENLEDHFSAHCCRHWNTTELLRAGMRREYVQWLRGDAIKDAVDIYYHILPEDVKKSYLACIPQLGV